MPQWQVSKAQSIDPFFSARLKDLSNRRSPSERLAPAKPRCIRLILDFHPVLERAGLQSAASEVCKVWGRALAELGLDFEIGVGWRGKASPLGILLRNSHAVPIDA